MRRRKAALAAAVALAVPIPARAVFFDDAIQLNILRQELQHTVQLGAQLEQLRQVLGSTRETLSFTRTIYAGVQDLQHLSTDEFLRESRAYFLAQNPPLAEAKYFSEDALQNGAHGYFNAAPVNRAIEKADLFGEAPRGGSATRITGYDSTAALGFGSDFDRVIAARARAARSTSDPDLAPYGAPPAPASATEGLIDYEMMRKDPGLAAALSQSRTNAQSASSTALEAYLRSLSASPGQAQLLAARSTSLTAAQVAQLNDVQARALALSEHQHAERVSAAEKASAEREAFSQALETRLARDFGTSRALPATPALTDR